MPSKPPDKPLARPLAAGQKHQRRTRVANGSATLMPSGDPHSAWGRRHAEILAVRVEDAGGQDNLSENRWSLIRHATFLDTELDHLAALRSAGGEVDMEIAAGMVGQLCRVLKTLGLDRVKPPMRTVDPLDAFDLPPEPKA